MHLHLPCNAECVWVIWTIQSLVSSQPDAPACSQALLLLEFLLKRGSLHCPRMARSELSQHLRALADFVYIGADGRDYGLNVRVRCV